MRTPEYIKGCIISRDNIWAWLLSNDLISIEWKTLLINIREKISDAWEMTSDIDTLRHFREKILCQNEVDIIIRLSEDFLGSSCKNFLGFYVNDFMKQWLHITKLWKVRNLFICQDILDLVEILDVSIPTISSELIQMGARECDFQWKADQADKQLKVHEKHLQSICQNFELSKETIQERDEEATLPYTLMSYLNSFARLTSRKIFDLLKEDSLRMVISHPDLLSLLPHYLSLSDTECFESIRNCIQNIPQRLKLIQECHLLLSLCTVQKLQCGGDALLPIPTVFTCPDGRDCIDTLSKILDLLNSYGDKTTISPEFSTSISLVDNDFDMDPSVLRLSSLVKNLLIMQRNLESLIASYYDRINQVSVQRQALKQRLQMERENAGNKKSIILNFIEKNARGKPFILDGFDLQE